VGMGGTFLHFSEEGVFIEDHRKDSNP